VQSTGRHERIINRSAPCRRHGPGACDLKDRLRPQPTMPECLNPPQLAALQGSCPTSPRASSQFARGIERAIVIIRPSCKFGDRQLRSRPGGVHHDDARCVAAAAFNVIDSNTGRGPMTPRSFRRRFEPEGPASTCYCRSGTKRVASASAKLLRKAVLDLLSGNEQFHPGSSWKTARVSGEKTFSAQERSSS